MAADIYKFLVIIAGLTVVFNLAGLPTGIGLLMERAGVDITNNPENITLSNLAITIGAILAAAGGVGIVAGLFGRSPSESFFMTTYAALLVSFVADIVVISNYAFATYDNWVGYVLLLILLPVGVGYMHSVVSWWGNKS